MLAVEVGVPAVFAAVVGDEDEVGGSCPGNSGQIFAVGITAEKGGAAVVAEQAHDLVVVFAAIAAGGEKGAGETALAEGEGQRRVNGDNFRVVQVQGERLPFFALLGVRGGEQLAHMEISQNMGGAADVVAVTVAEHEGMMVLTPQ